MTCERVTALASDALDVLLTGPERALLEAHLGICADCADRNQQLLALHDLLFRSEPGDEPSTAGQAQLWLTIERDRASSGGVLRRFIAPLLALDRLLPSTAGLALLIAALIGLGWPRVPAPLEPPTPLPPIALHAQDQLPRSAETVLTVWDSQADLIVASVVPDGLGQRQLEEMSSELTAGLVQRAGYDPDVCMFLYERIDVRG